MGRPNELTGEVFLDASYAIALAARNDQYHERAEALAERCEEGRVRLITTRAVLLEIGNSLARQRYRGAARKLLAAMEGDPLVEIVPITERLYERGLRTYCASTDKEWGITDCISFTVMRERGLTDALTTDHHFEQAGFRALLLGD